MNHLMVEYLAQSLSQDIERTESRKNRLMAHEQRVTNRAQRRRRWAR